MSAETPDSALSGAPEPSEPAGETAATFHFACQRSGNCCRVGHGRVWIEEQHLPTYAELMGATVQGFVARNVVQVGARLSLQERTDGRCVLLDGNNQCLVYESRPEQCRTFPYWPELLADPSALERAARYCPGIQRFPEAALYELVLPQVAALLEELLVRQRALKTEPPQQDAVRWGNALEVDLFLATGVERHLFVPELVAELGVKLQNLASASGYPWSSAAWQRLLQDRQEGWLKRGSLPTLS
jgi:hypothetical protein